MIDKLLPQPLVSDEDILDVETAAPGTFYDPAEAGENVVLDEYDDGSVDVTFDPYDEERDIGATDDPSANLAEFMDDEDLMEISLEIEEMFEDCRRSRKDWDEVYAKGLDLLGFKQDKERSEPFPGASAVHHPVLAEAATQFASHAYKELFPSQGPVKTAIFGEKTPERHKRSMRLKTYFNYHLTTEMPNYEDDFDTLLWHLPLAGSAFKKTYYDMANLQDESVFVPAQNIYVPFGTRHLSTAACIIEVIDMPLNELVKKQVKGWFRELDVMGGDDGSDLEQIRVVQAEIAGEDPSQQPGAEWTTRVLECHVELDLPGMEERVKKPYVVTILKDTWEILAIRRNDHPNMPGKKKEYYTHYKFMQGFGFYGLSLIHMIGGLTHASTGALRALLDAGAFSNLPAGFKARGMRVEGDNSPLAPGELRDVDVPGGAIKDHVMALPFKGPDPTLYQLLGFLVNAAQRFASTTDLNVGEGNQNAPVGTTVAMLESGQRVLTAIHKRLHKAHKYELGLIAECMIDFPREYPAFMEADFAPDEDLQADIGIVPVTDPTMFSQAQRIALAQSQLQLAQSAPEIHNLPEAYRMMYEALGVTDIDRLMLTDEDDHGKPQPKDPAAEHMDVLEQVPLVAFEGQNHMAHIMAHLTQSLSPITASNPRAMLELHKHVLEHVQIMSKEQLMATMQQQGVTGQQLQQDPGLMAQFDMQMAQIVSDNLQQVRQLSMQMQGAGQPPPPDPIVELKKEEMMLKDRQAQVDDELERNRLALEAQKAAHKQEHDKKRLQQVDRMQEDRQEHEMAKERLRARLKPQPTQSPGGGQ